MPFRRARSNSARAGAILMLFAACSPADFTLDSTDATSDSASTTDSSSDASASKDATSGDSTSDVRGDVTPPPSDSPPADVACKCRDGCCPGVPAVECLCGAGDACPLKHDNGWGDTYWFCGPLGTPGSPANYTKDMALKAAKSWNPGTISDYPCGTGNPAVSTDKPGATVLCNVWVYGGPLAGYGQDMGGGPCQCPTAASTHKWN